ncbi:MAG: hypothetical protein WB723_00715 [Candidatus Acidiferrales bacterium]
MADHIVKNESIRVLIFVVGPLLLLVAVMIFALVRSSKRLTAKFPGFSVNFSRVGREDAYIVYRDKNRHFEFYVFHVGPAKGKDVHLQAPKNVRDEDIRDIASRLAEGLTRLGFSQYSIRREGEARVIASSDQPKS